MHGGGNPADRDHRTLRHSIVAEVALNPGSSATPNNSARSFLKDSTFSVMLVGRLL